MARRLAEMSKNKMSIHGKSANDTKIEEHLSLEESSISLPSQDDYKKLKLENDFLRLKLEASNAITRDLETSTESLEKYVKFMMRCMSMQEKETKKSIMYTAEEEYENPSANLQANCLAKNEKETIMAQEKLIAKNEEMEKLQKKMIAHYEEDIKKLQKKLEKYKKIMKELKNRLANLENQNENLNSSISSISDTGATDHRLLIKTDHN